MSSLIKSLISIGLLVISSFISVQNSEAAYSISKVGGTYTYTPGNYTGLTVNGEFSVDALGDANYSIPLKVPKGSNSFHPSLGLHYNSSNTKHILGIGWSLTGVSKISRCASNIAQDGKIRGIRFDSQDKFCIDGQKLKLSSGTYGANGATYVTEMHSFSKITSNGVAGSGPQSFTVISDDGTVTVYGGTVDSRQIATGKSEVFVWSVSSITNSMGSKIDFIYEGDIYESRIKEITYGGATHDFNKVSFHYLDDPNGQVRSYLAGSEFQLKKVLQTIKGYRGGVVEPIIQYNLVYNFASPNITALTSIEECHNSIGTLSCLPKVEFIGGTLDQSFSNETPWSGSHFVSDTGGSYDRINEYKFFAEEHFLHDDESTGEVSGLADLNGDGLVDFFRPQSNLIGLNTGSSFVQTAWSNSTFLYPDADNKTGANDTTPEEPVIALVSNSLKRYKKEVIYGQRLNEPPTVATDMGVIDINGDGLPDLVRPNLPNPVRLNNGNGFDSEIAWPNANALSQGLPFTACYAGCISYSGTDFTNPKIIHRSYIDMNGDGLVDAYAPDLDPYGSTPNLWLNNGSGFDSPIRLNPPDPTRPYISKHDADGLGFDGPISGYFDMNGDGLVDFVDAERNGGTVWLNTGNGFTSALVWTFPSQAGGHINKEYYGSGYINNQSMLMDMNADGLPDIINLSTNEVCYNMGTHFQTTCESWGATLSSDFYGSLSTTDHNGVYRGATLQTMMDVNGDGLPDFLRVQESGGVTKLMINQNKPISRYIHKIYNGKNTITINYKHLSDPSMNYVKTASNSSSKYVVESFETEDGIGGIYKRVYSYKNLLFDRFGRGLKGFEEVTTKDLNAKTRSVVKYKQSWPYTGSVEHTWEYAGTDTSGDNGKLIKETIQDWDTMNIVDGATTSVFNYIKKSEEKDYEYNHAVPATPTRHTITDFVYYPNGYIDTTTESYGNGFTDTKLTKVVYYSTANNISGKPDTVTVTFNGVTSEQRQSKFYYYSHGQLQKEVVQPGGGADIELSTEYLYDSFGNRTTTTAKASGELDRISITGYDPQGIYATTQTNPKGHLSQTFYTSRGLVDYTLDVNGFKTKFTYDDFGRVRFSTVFDGLTNALTTETQYKDADIGPVSAYYIKSIAPDGTYSIQWFDYFDRIVRKLSKSFNQTVCVDTVYNNKGQITHVSDPTDCLDTTTTLTNPLYTQTYYDDAGRVYDTILPDGTTTRTSYNGLNTTVTADYLGKNQSTTTEKNQKGQIVKVTDPLNHYKTFTYNKFGNLTGIISTSSDDITMIYDRLGECTVVSVKT